MPFTGSASTDALLAGPSSNLDGVVVMPAWRQQPLTGAELRLIIRAAPSGRTGPGRPARPMAFARQLADADLHGSCSQEVARLVRPESVGEISGALRQIADP